MVFDIKRHSRESKKNLPQRHPITFALHHFPEGYPFKCVEVGVYEGDHSQEILTVLEPECLWLIDMWTDIKVSKSGVDYIGHSQKDWNEKYYKVLTRFQNNPNVSVVRMSGDDAAEILPDDLNLVYIDACHDYECVLQDMHTWYPKIRKGGILSGDDYSRDSVVQAVAEFLKEYPQHKLQTSPTQWWFVKD